MLADIISKIKKNVVVVRNPDGSHGSDLVLDARGIIVTNIHVVDPGTPGLSLAIPTRNMAKAYNDLPPVADLKEKTYCKTCGGTVQVNDNKCSSCNTQNKKDAKYYMICGTTLAIRKAKKLEEKTVPPDVIIKSGPGSIIWV